MKRSLVTLMAVAAAVLLAAPVASASRSQAIIFDGGDAVFSDGTREQALDQIESLGGREIRVLITWRNVVPSSSSRTKPRGDARNPNSSIYDWGGYERLINSARQRRMKVHIGLSGPVPRWATRRKRDNLTNPSTAEFQRFVTAVGRKFRSARPATWSMWNEPNQPSFLRPQNRTTPKLYRNLHLAGVRGLRAANVRRPRVLFGELAGRARGAMPALRFMRESLCLDARYRRKGRCARIRVSGFAVHTYATRFGPFQRPPKRDDILLNSMPRLANALDRAARAGRINRGVGIYIMESGTVTRPRRDGASNALQPVFNATLERIAYENSRVKAFSQYLLTDPSTGAGGTFTTGLRSRSTARNPLGRAKPGYEGWMLPLSARRSGNRVSLWGAVRPARRTSLRVEQCSRRCSSSRARWTRLFTKRTNNRGYWTGTTAFRRGREYRAVWRDSRARETYEGPAIEPLTWRAFYR